MTSQKATGAPVIPVGMRRLKERKVKNVVAQVDGVTAIQLDNGDFLGGVRNCELRATPDNSVAIVVMFARDFTVNGKPGFEEMKRLRDSRPKVVAAPEKQLVGPDLKPVKA